MHINVPVNICQQLHLSQCEATLKGKMLKLVVDVFLLTLPSVICHNALHEMPKGVFAKLTLSHSNWFTVYRSLLCATVSVCNCGKKRCSGRVSARNLSFYIGRKKCSSQICRVSFNSDTKPSVSGRGEVQSAFQQATLRNHWFHISFLLYSYKHVHTKQPARRHKRRDFMLHVGLCSFGFPHKHRTEQITPFVFRILL